jgi:hypothetical protein
MGSELRLRVVGRAQALASPFELEQSTKANFNNAETLD